MATTKQIEANKHNAKLSPGPTSVLGKARSSMNALKTGVFAKHLLLPDDNAEEFGRLRLELYGEWQPTGPTEKSLVERLVALLWRQQRIYRAETGLYEMYRRCPDGVGGVATALARDGQDTEAFTRLHRMDRGIEHSIAVIIGLLQKLQKERGTRKGLVLEPALCRGAPTAPSSPKSAGASDGDVPQI